MKTPEQLAADEVRKEAVEYRNSFEKYLSCSQQTINDSDYEEALTLEERSYANQLILNTMDWLAASDPNTGDPYERSKTEIMDCKSSVEYYLKPLVNKVYGRQLAAGSGQPEPEASTASTSQVNAVLDEYDRQTGGSSGSGGSGGVQPPSNTIITKKRRPHNPTK